MEVILLGALCACSAIAVWRAVLALQHHREVARELRLLGYELDDV